MAAELIQHERVLRLRNDHVDLVIDRRAGQILEIWNRRIEWNFKSSPGGAWPFSHWIRHPVYPWWGGRPRQNAMSAEEYVSTPDITFARRNGGIALTMRYAEIGVVRRMGMEMYPGALDGTASPELMADHEPAGISGVVEIRLPDDADYFLFRAKLDLRNSRCDVLRFGSGWGGAICADRSHEHEHVAAPEWFGGAIYHDPHRAISRKEMVGKPMIWPYIGGSPNSLLAGWIDFYGRRGGLGIGILAASGQIGAFEAAVDGDGLSLNWRTFDLAGVDTYFGDHAKGFDGLYPLEAGRTWTSDWWILAPHEGDWHRMADIYRELFNRTFAGERLTAETISPAVRNSDYIMPAWLPHTPQCRHFDDFPGLARRALRTLGIKPRNALLWLIGTQDQGFDTTFPDFFPMHERCGGEQAARRAIAKLDAMGLGGSFIYTNPNYNHPLAKLHVPKADTGVRANHGDFACFASPAWQRMWLEKLAPRLQDVGACGIQIDQWPLLFCPCRRKGHGHRVDSASALRGQITGKRRWLRAMRDKLTAGQPNWFFLMEAGSDIVGALADIWTFGRKSFYPGGTPMPEIARFAHPQYAMTTGGSMLESLINGSLICTPDVGRPDSDDACRRLVERQDFHDYRRVRAELRAAKAPGFPHGYRHTLGLDVGSPNLHARSYTDANGITIVYYANKTVNTAITVRPAELGHEGDEQTIRLRMKAGEAGWWSESV